MHWFQNATADHSVPTTTYATKPILDRMAQPSISILISFFRTQQNGFVEKCSVVMYKFGRSDGYAASISDSTLSLVSMPITATIAHTSEQATAILRYRN